MKFLASHESSTRGTFDFPIELYAVQFIHELLHGRYDLTDPLPRTPAHRQ